MIYGYANVHVWEESGHCPKDSWDESRVRLTAEAAVHKMEERETERERQAAVHKMEERETERERQAAVHKMEERETERERQRNRDREMKKREIG